MQGAGGVGGLLSVTLNSEPSTPSFFPTYDGNGNVSEYLDLNGNTVAHYEYDPFGKTVVATGSKAADFSHRFSTKPLDVTTRLYYYGYRFYDPETGRWPSRDPIEERGGVNLYGFVNNNGVNRWDLFGMEPNEEEVRLLMNWINEARNTSASDQNKESCGVILQRLEISKEISEVREPWSPLNGPQQFALYKDPNGGWIDQWGAHHRSICMSCHAPTPEAERNKLGILYGKTGWALFYVDVAMIASPMAAEGGVKLIGSVTRAFSSSSARSGTMVVSRWGKTGLLESGDWVMKGPVSRSTFLRSFKWDPNPTNMRVPYKQWPTGENHLVDIKDVFWPRGISKWKGIYGQRMYIPLDPK